MAYVITAPCVADYSCLEVCPVDCIRPSPMEDKFENTEQLYIDPERCIDCGACVEACPVLAISKPITCHPSGSSMLPSIKTISPRGMYE